MTDRTADPLDRLLRRGAAAPPATGGVCLDPEQLAAFADGTLPAAERASVEAHAADCSRCLAVLAAMAQSAEPLVQREERIVPAWRRWTLPAAAAAAVLAMTINVVLTLREVPARVAPTPAAAERAPAAPPTIGPVTVTPDTSAQSAAATTRSASRPGAASPAAKTAARPAAQAEPERRAAAPSARPGPESPAAERQAVSKAAPAAAEPAAAAPPPPPAQPLTVTESVAVQDQARGVPGARALFVAAGAFQVLSPDARTIWRASGTAVERSTDAGATWAREAITAPAPLRAGSSPAADVCWLVGNRGTVLRWTDGQGWQRIAFPEPLDLTAVRATGPQHADIITADGRTFRTSDGGATWSRP